MRQFPGPISALEILFFLSIVVMLAIPPKFNIIIEDLYLFWLIIDEKLV